MNGPRCDAKWNQIGNLRLFAFLLSVVGLIWDSGLGSLVIWVAGIVLLVAFFVLVWWHNRVGRTRRRVAELRLINEEATLRSKRLWEQLPVRYNPQVRPDDPYARDLNVFGHASLFQLADTAGTLIGERTSRVVACRRCCARNDNRAAGCCRRLRPRSICATSYPCAAGS